MQNSAKIHGFGSGISRQLGPRGARALLLGTAAIVFPLDSVEAQVASAAATAADEGLIIVTGTRREVSLQDAPINISAVGSETLARQRIDDIRDLMGFVNGVTILDTGPRSTGRIVLRGLSADGTGIFGNNVDNGVAIYLGEIPLYQDFKFIDMDRVEVLLGPQGTLYGVGTLAGAIRYMPRRPDPVNVSGEAYARGTAQAESDDLGYQGWVAVNTPIIQDHVALRLVAGYFFEPGFIDYPVVLKVPGVSLPQPAPLSLGTPEQRAANFNSFKDVNFERTFSARATALFQSSERFQLYVTYAYQRTTTDGFQANSAGVLGTGRFERAARYLEPQERETHLIGFEINAELGDIAKLVSSTGLTRQRLVGLNDNTDLLLDLDYDYELFPGFSSYADPRTRYRQINQEVRLVSAHGGPISWTAGFFFNRFIWNNRRDEYVPGYTRWLGVTFRPDDLEYISFVNTRTRELALFGEATWQVTPKWQVTGGIRWFEYNAFATGGTDLPLLPGGRRRTPYPLIQFDPSRIRSGSTDDNGVVWKANTSYRFSDDLLAYFTYSTGYRIGGVNRVPPCVLPIDTSVQNICALPDELVFGPDETKNKELGIRYQLFDRRLTGSLALYHINWDGVQISSRTQFGALGIIRNGAEAVSKGLEFQASAAPTDRLRIDASYSLTDARLTADAPGIIVINPADLNGDGILETRVDGKTGDRLPGSAKHIAAVGATYTTPLPNGDDLTFNWTATYRGNILTRVGARGFGEKIPDFWVHRGALTYAVTDSLSFGLWADNILNKYAVTSVGQTTQQIGVNDGVVLRYYSKSVLRPRSYGLEARFQF
ncbi:MAG: TonB-dependent receptor [Thermaurantiacus tibetensis]|uniref:TonB-dependent receptor n=1 Tax=Thermaurantiacus tibetensis TaxID=2759035 RepID=UPI001890763A|nr:TonB-dependent receptor [Thermaurantiacus tibetensis]